MPTVEIKKKHNAKIILGILLDGHAVVVDGEEYLWQDGVFGVRRHVWQDGVRGDDMILGMNMTVAGFIKWCETMPDEVITRAIFAHVVQLQRERRP